MAPLGDSRRLPVATSRPGSAGRVAIRDVLEAPELDDPTLGDVARADATQLRAVLATPIVAFERVIGVLGSSPCRAGAWTPAEISLAEAVAREAAIAIDTSRLLRESTRQAQVERGFYRIASVLSEPLSRARRRSTRSPRPRQRRSAATWRRCCARSGTSSSWPAATSSPGPRRLPRRGAGER